MLATPLLFLVVYVIVRLVRRDRRATGKRKERLRRYHDELFF